MVKAFKVYLPGYTCVAMHESDISDNADSSDDDDDTSDSDDMGDSPIDSAVFDHLPAEHDSCFAHTSQLVLHEGLKEAGPHITKLIVKAAKVVSFVRKSTFATDILEVQKCLQALDTMHVTQYERNCLQDLCDILKSFETLHVQEQKGIQVYLQR